MKAKSKDYYSTSCLNAQLNKLRRFYGIKSRFIRLAYIDIKDEQKNLKITKYAWNCFETENHQPDLYHLSLIARNFHIAIEYFFINGAEPIDFIENELLDENSINNIARENEDIHKYSADFFHLQLKKIRLFRGYAKQSEAAVEISISRQVWCLWESEKRLPNARQFLLVVEFFKVKIDYFFIHDALPKNYIIKLCRKKSNGIPVDKKKNSNSTFNVKFISLQIKKIRLFFNLKSQKVLYTFLKINRMYLSSWENGRRIPDLRKLVLLSNFFLTEVEYFFSKDAEPAHLILDGLQKNDDKFSTTAINGTLEEYATKNFYPRLENVMVYRGCKSRRLVRNELKIFYRDWISWVKNSSYPTLKHLTSLANYFKVRIEYFLTHDATVENYIINSIIQEELT